MIRKEEVVVGLLEEEARMHLEGEEVRQHLEEVAGGMVAFRSFREEVEELQNRHLNHSLCLPYFSSFDCILQPANIEMTCASNEENAERVNSSDRVCRNKVWEVLMQG